MVPGDTDQLDLTWELGVPASGLDLQARKVRLADGRELPHDGLVIATGAAPRRLPGTEGVDGVHVVRTLDDCLRLRADLDREPARVVVVGAGFIGAEVAATCRGRGIDVTMVEPLAVPLGRVMPPSIGEVVAALHRDHGVDLRLGTGVAALVTDGDGRVSGVDLGDGSSVEASVVVVGVGVRPNTAWLEGSGLELRDGVVCDETCLAAPCVVAAGDVARWRSERYGDTLRIEHWDHASDQGEYAARRLLAWAAGEPVEPYDPVPWFWSDQYDRKIQLAGRCDPDDDVVVVEGSFEERKFVALFGRAGRLVGVLGMNRPAPVMRWRNRMVDGATWDEARAAAAT